MYRGRRGARDTVYSALMVLLDDHISGGLLRVKEAKLVVRWHREAQVGRCVRRVNCPAASTAAAAAAARIPSIRVRRRDLLVLREGEPHVERDGDARPRPVMADHVVLPPHGKGTKRPMRSTALEGLEGTQRVIKGNRG